MIRGILFDLDGVLVSTHTLHTHAWRTLAERHGLTLTRATAESLRGLDRLSSLRRILADSRRRLPEKEEHALAEEKNTIYLEALRSIGPEHTLPGVRDRLSELRDLRVPMAICSVSRNAPEILERTGLRNWIDAIVPAAMLARTKPDPEIFFKGAALLGLADAPCDCLVVEDAPVGLEAADTAGMATLAIGPAVATVQASHHALGLHEISTGQMLALRPSRTAGAWRRRASA